jgi:hypothetical protein
MPWDMNRFTHGEMWDLEEKHLMEQAEAAARSRRLGG